MGRKKAKRGKAQASKTTSPSTQASLTQIQAASDASPKHQRESSPPRSCRQDMALALQTSPVITAVPHHVLDVIYFYDRTDPWYEFTNFFLRPIELDGKVWPTSEHYFQAAKFVAYPEIAEYIRTAPTPREAFRRSREYSHMKRTDWENVKSTVMKEALRAKFTQHIDLQQLLLATENAVLVEHTSNDRCWGDGGDGSGENRLGKMLMSLRDVLRQSANLESSAERISPRRHEESPSKVSEEVDVKSQHTHGNTLISWNGAMLAALCTVLGIVVAFWFRNH